MFAGILTWFLGGGLSSIENALTDAYKAKLTAQNDQDRIAADVTIQSLQAKRDVMIGEARKWSINALVRALFAVPVAAYYAKIFFFDKVLALGSTDPLSDDLTWTARVIISFYFLYEGATSVAKVIRQ
jgi:hypothetical protein